MVESFGIRPTRLIPSAVAPDLFLKLECELPTGSFKVRGALYALAAHMQRRTIREVVTASTGNHGAAVAYAAKQHGIAATIFLPRNPNPVKAQTIARLGARLEESGADLSDTRRAADRYAERTGAFVLDDATVPEIPIGAGSMAAEILDDMPDARTIIVPVGDSALIRGVAAAAKARQPGVRIVGVQAERAPSYYLSWRKGSVVTTETADTIADGLATRNPVAGNVADIRGLVDDMVLVSEDAMLRAIHTLLFEDHIVAEPSGAAPLAAYLGMAQKPSGRAVLIVTGSNIPADVLRRAVDLRPR
ncbi:MAG TPA: pyridoxal-phosphate dependent enzyme [Vicinamibacterales bacterium]|nr:pyridoxal-phosphate dependent enzyme [Vicinamibacterales bacterium]